MMHFSLEEKLIIAGGCATAVVLFAMIMACKISPYCCLYRACPFRAKYDDDEDDGDGRGKPKSKGNFKYHMINYGHQAPAVPSIKLTSLEKSSVGAAVAAAMTFTGPRGDALPAYTALANSGNVPCKVQTVRSHKTSTSSVSGSSTVSSDSGITTNFRQPTHAAGGVTSALSSDGGEVPNVPVQPPSLDFSILYNAEDEKLTIHVRGATRVPLNVYGGANDTQVQVLVVKDLKSRWRRRSDIPLDELMQAVSSNNALNSTPSASPDLTRSSATAPGTYDVAEFKTHFVKRQVDPIFDERFMVNVSRKDKKRTCIKFVLRSIDRFSHYAIVGTCHIGLANFGNGTSETVSTEDFNLALQNYTPDLGELMLSLCYLPTAERLHVNVMKVTNLKPPVGLTIANPYIKAVVVRRGKVVEKHSTPVQFHTMNPVFNEALIFDVPVTELEKITLLVTVIHQDSSDVAELRIFDGRHRSRGSTGSDRLAMGRRSSSANGLGGRRRSVGNIVDDQPNFEDSGPQIQKSRSVHALRTKPYAPLGRLAFGSLAAIKGSPQRHWHEMLKYPRKQVAQWHKLQP